MPGFVRVPSRRPTTSPWTADGRSSLSVKTSAGRAPHAMADYTAWLKGPGLAGGNWAGSGLRTTRKDWSGPRANSKAGAGMSWGWAVTLPAMPGDSTRSCGWRGNGVYLMFCLGTYGEFTEGGYFNEGCLGSNPYNARNGGPCTIRPTSGPTGSAKLYQRRLRTSSPGGEAFRTCLPGSSGTRCPQPPPAIAWMAEMAAYLKHHDPYPPCQHDLRRRVDLEVPTSTSL